MPTFAYIPNAKLNNCAPFATENMLELSQIEFYCAVARIFFYHMTSFMVCILNRIAAKPCTSWRLTIRLKVKGWRKLFQLLRLKLDFWVECGVGCEKCEVEDDTFEGKLLFEMIARTFAMDWVLFWCRFKVSLRLSLIQIPNGFNCK